VAQNTPAPAHVGLALLLYGWRAPLGMGHGGTMEDDTITVLALDAEGIARILRVKDQLYSERTLDAGQRRALADQIRLAVDHGTQIELHPLCFSDDAGDHTHCDDCGKLIDNAPAGCQSAGDGEGCKGWDFRRDVLGIVGEA